MSITRLISVGMKAIATVFVLFPFVAPAQAIYLSESGGVARLSGTFEKDDEKIFAQFLAQKRATPLHTLWLESRGGAVYPAMSIGQLVRKAHLATAMRADAASCDSSCTLVFVSGVRRHYVNGNSVFEGTSSLSGLGFHSANVRGDAVRPATKSHEATAEMGKFYRNMGVSGASDLMDRASITTVYRPSGATALKSRIATSLAAP